MKQTRGKQAQWLLETINSKKIEIFPMSPVISFSPHPQGCWVGRVWGGGFVFLLARPTLT